MFTYLYLSVSVSICGVCVLACVRACGAQVVKLAKCGGVVGHDKAFQVKSRAEASAADASTTTITT